MFKFYVYNVERSGDNFPRAVSLWILKVAALLLITGILVTHAHAQVTVSQNIILSYTGFHTSTTVQLKQGNLGFYAGPKLMLTQSGSLVLGPWGVDAGVNYYLKPSSQKLAFFINACYLNSLSISREGANGYKPRGFLQEYGIGYGLQFNFNKKLSLVNTMSVGRYTEMHHLTGIQEKYRYSGFNTILKLGVIYSLHKI